MQTGTKISLAAHGALVTWAVFGAWFPSEPLPMQVQEVSVITADQFAALSRQSQAPEISDLPAALPRPVPEAEAPEPALTEETPPENTPPEPVEPPQPDEPVTELPEPEPTPAPIPPVPDMPVPPEVSETAPPVLQPEVSQPADRVAPEPVAPPPEDTVPDDIAQPEVAPEEGAEAAQDVQEATAPEAAGDRIATEADEPVEEPVVASAPLQSVRPKARPRRPEPEAETVAQPAEETPVQDAQQDAVNDALAEALAGGGEVEAPVPSGPPLTAGEKDALRVSVSNCWNVGSLSTEALRTTVVVGVTLAQDGKPDVGSIRMLSSEGGSQTAAKQAFEAARRAIIRCGARGYQLPPEKYAQWRDIEMTFNPERMRIK